MKLETIKSIWTTKIFKTKSIITFFRHFHNWKSKMFGKKKLIEKNAKKQLEKESLKHTCSDLPILIEFRFSNNLLKNIFPLKSLQWLKKKSIKFLTNAIKLFPNWIICCQSEILKWFSIGQIRRFFVIFGMLKFTAVSNAFWN